MKSVEEIIQAERTELSAFVSSPNNSHLNTIRQQIEEKGFFTAGIIENQHRETPFDLIMHYQTAVDDRGIFHDHNCFELAYVYRGSCVNRRPGYEVSMHEGDMLLMNPRAVHCMCTASPEDVVFNFLIPTNVMKQLFTNTRSENSVTDFCMDYLHNMRTGPDFLIISGDSDMVLHTLIGQLIREYHEKLPGYEVFLQAGLQQVFVLMARRLSCSLRALPLKDTSRMMRDVILYISKNAATVTLKDLATAFSYHEKHISRQMKKELGMGFTEFLQQQRLNNASELLTHTNMSVAQISREVGYRNVHFFYDLFEKQFGTTPAVWRTDHSAGSL